MRKPARTYSERKQAAFNAGLNAFKEGQPITACPIKKHQGLQQSWKEGWLAANAERQKQSSGMFIARVPDAYAPPANAAKPAEPRRQQATA